MEIKKVKNYLFQTIQYISKKYSRKGTQDYVVRINDAEDGLATLLIKAGYAVEKSRTGK